MVYRLMQLIEEGFLQPLCCFWACAVTLNGEHDCWVTQQGSLIRRSVVSICSCKCVHWQAMPLAVHKALDSREVCRRNHGWGDTHDNFQSGVVTKPSTIGA